MNYLEMRGRPYLSLFTIHKYLPLVFACSIRNTLVHAYISSHSLMNGEVIGVNFEKTQAASEQKELHNVLCIIIVLLTGFGHGAASPSGDQPSAREML